MSSYKGKSKEERRREKMRRAFIMEHLPETRCPKCKLGMMLIKDEDEMDHGYYSYISFCSNEESGCTQPSIRGEELRMLCWKQFGHLIRYERKEVMR